MDETRLHEVTRRLDTNYRFIRKADEEYLAYLNGIVSKDEIPFIQPALMQLNLHREPDGKQRHSITELDLETLMN